jgi:hypothetical protein
MSLRHVMTGCVLYAALFGGDHRADATSPSPTEDQPTQLAVGVGVGSHYLTSLRFEVRPLQWVSVAGRLGWTMGVWRELRYRVYGNDNASRWDFDIEPMVLAGLQLSGMLPIYGGHGITLRAGADYGFPTNPRCDGAENESECSPSSVAMFDASLGWSWQMEWFEARVDLGAVYARSLDASSELNTLYPTLLVTILCWLS